MDRYSIYCYAKYENDYIIKRIIFKLKYFKQFLFNIFN